MPMILTALLLGAFALSPARCPLDVRELRVRSPAGHELAVRLAIPRGRRRVSLAVMISGAGPEDRDYSTTPRDSSFPGNHAFARVEGALACARIGTARFDEVGTGRSSGSYRDHATTATLAEDVVVIVDALRRHPHVDSARIALVGHSEGGAIAAIVASSRPVAAVVLLAAPVKRGDDIMRDQLAWAAAVGPADSAEAVDEDARRRREDRWYRFFLGFDPSPYHARVRVPILILQGEDDWQVTPAQADSIARLASSSGNAYVHCIRYPGVGHAFLDERAWVVHGNASTPAFSHAVMRDVVTFLGRALVTRDVPRGSATCTRQPAGLLGATSRRRPTVAAPPPSA